MIPVVMTMDKNYIIPTKVSIGSILASAKDDTFYEIHILCDKALDDFSRKKILELADRSRQLQIEFNEIVDVHLKEAKTFSRFPVASYYRLFISQIIAADKCIFIDGDTIVQIDLGQLYEMELGDCYVAGVKDAQIEKLDNHEKQLGLPSIKGYINAGVLLFNLKKIREDNLDREFITAISGGYQLMDQDIINKYCYGKIKHLPLRFNFFADFYRTKGNQTNNIVYLESEFQDAERQIGVLHYNGFFKPWLCTRLKVNQIWWQYAKKILEIEDYEEQMKKALQFEKESDWSFILGKMKEVTQIAVIGFSEIGKKLIDLLNRYQSGKLMGICDNDIQKQGSEYQGFFVQSVERVHSLYPKAFWIIASQNGYVELGKQLQKLGVEEKRIVRYIYKSIVYYEGLDEKYQDYEIQMFQ